MMISVYTHTSMNTAGVASSLGAEELVYYIQLPVDTRRVRRSLLSVLLLLVTAALLLPWGTLTSLFSSALLVVLLRNYLSFNSRLRNKAGVPLKRTQRKNRIICFGCRMHQNVCFTGHLKH